MIRILRCNWGVSAVEFALLTPVVTMILLAVVDFGLAWEARMRLEEAVATGAQYALRTGAGVNAADVVTVVQNTSGLYGVQDAGTSYTATNCYCYPTDWNDTTRRFTNISETVASAAQGCSKTCSSGLAGRYVVIKASYQYPPVLSATPWFTDTTMTEFTLVRVD